MLDPSAAAPVGDHKVAAAVTLASMYAVFAGWMYVAWYQHHKPLSQYKFGGDGWLGYTTYAGGEDKFGHAWSTMALARLGTEMLSQWGGFDRTKSMLVATGLSELLFIGVEVRDGFFFEFSFSDLAGDTTGALIALALMQFPRLDELFDFRVQYFPSSDYINKLDGSSPCPVGGCSKWNIAEDYSGQTYILALHLGGIHALRDMKYGTWSRFVDVGFGFDTRNYKPPPDPDPVTGLYPPHHQNLFLGVSLNAQGLFDYLFERHHDSLRKVTHGLFEVFNLPFTLAPVPGLEWTRTPHGTVDTGGA